MTKQLYEEALADLKKVKEVAEADAQRAVLAAVTPRIRNLIESELLRESDRSDFSSSEGDLLTDVVPTSPSVDASTPEGAISLPDEEGKVTLDIDALCGDEASGVSEYELSAESIDALTPILTATKFGTAQEFELNVYRLGERVEKFKKAGRLVRESTEYHSQIVKMISLVENMYDYVQKSVTDDAKKMYETKLETYFRELNKLTEQKMSQKTKKIMNEEDVTLKLTGLPDDVDLESVGVDLITGDEGDDLGAEDVDAGEEPVDGDDSGDADLGDLDLDDAGDDDLAGEEDDMGEALNLSDDTVVEIDEGMLRREIARMRRLREEAVPSSDGSGVDANALDDFGGASDEGEPIEHDLADKSIAKAALPLGEADGDLDNLDEDDDVSLDQIGDKRTRDDFGNSATSVPSLDKDNPDMRYESLRRRMAFEARLQERAKRRASSLKSEVAKARSRKDLRKEALLRKEYASVARRFNESFDRSKKLKRRLVAEAACRPRIGYRHNGNPVRSAESKTEVSLRNKLAETNLINAKLLFTNKLLQNDQLTSRQKAQVIEQLDSTKTVREAKLVYESLARTLAGMSKPVNESRDRKVLGSSSRTTRPASTQTLNEGYESERWAKLAGITK